MSAKPEPICGPGQGRREHQESVVALTLEMQKIDQRMLAQERLEVTLQKGPVTQLIRLKTLQGKQWPCGRNCTGIDIVLSALGLRHAPLVGNYTSQKNVDAYYCTFICQGHHSHQIGSKPCI